MILSRILMVLALAVLAYLVWITMTNSSETPKVAPAPPATGPALSQGGLAPVVPATGLAQPQGGQEQPQGGQELPQGGPAAGEPAEVAKFTQEHFTQNIPIENNIVYDTNEFEPPANITYEHFADVSGISDSVHGAAPFGANAPVNEGDMATVKYTGLVDAQPGDVIQIEGTDLLTAPLVDNMLYTNSIANTNRNASQDLRGDIPLQFNSTYTPFYSSVIYGAPLSEKQMTIGKL